MTPMSREDDAGRPALLTEPEAAARLGLSPSSLEKLRRRGRGPIARRIGRLVRYRRDDLDEWSRKLPTWR